ncbi:MAG: DUF3244 domain-containing protein [Prevotella sp.]|nr:DUF3244 domain-containing protein [Prevotella sp.]
MTKKSIIISLLAAMLSFGNVSVYADPESIDLEYEDPDDGNEGLNKSPISIPEISLEDHTLYFYTPCDGCTLRLLDENDNVVYSTVIPTNTTSLVLPSTLSGEYEIQIIQGNICFYGYINL